MAERLTSPTLSRVVRGQLCSGCGLCAGVSGGAVRMDAASGYNRPVQSAPLSSAQEATIAATCPGAVVAPWEPVARHPYWGVARRSGVGHATDGDLRHHASSGGLLSALLIEALESGLVDDVIHVHADPASPTRNVVRRVETVEAIFAGAGSRYAPSSPLAEIESLLTDGRRHAVVGKPCDISALRLLSRRDPRVDAAIPLMLSFFCGGVPNHSGADAILQRLGVAPGDVTAFRYRGDGWPGFATAELADGESRRMSYVESWGGQLSKVVQFRCKICPDPVGGVADVACADAWHGDARGYPLFEEQEGRSLVLARTEKGAALLEAAIGTGRVEIAPLAIDEIDAMQPSQARRKRMMLARAAALAVTLQPWPRMAGLDVLRAARRGGLIETARNFLGLVRRIVIRNR